MSISKLRNGCTKSCGCLTCSKHVSQNSLAKIIKDIFGKHIEQNYRNIEWLKNSKTGYKLEIDIYVPKIKLAIEYDGEQHIKPVRFGGVSYESAN